jgi:hypothetical protein
MPSISLFLFKYGVPLGKVLWALYQGDGRAGTEAGLKGADSWLNEKAKTPSPSPTLEALQNRILQTLSQLPDWEGTEDDWNAAASEAAETLAVGFTFESLAKNLDTPERLPVLWYDRRRATGFSVDSVVRGLHDRLLTETARALVPVLQDLPGFRNWLVGYTARKFDVLLERADAHTEAHRTLSETLQRLLGQEGVRDAEFEQRYRNALIRHLDRVELFIERQDVPIESREQELTVAYVTLELTRGRSGTGALGGVPADTLLDGLPEGPPRVLIVGPAGCGKTTLLRWIGLEAARPNSDVSMSTSNTEPSHFPNPERAPASPWREHIPFLVRLRDWPAGDFPTPKSLHLGAKCAADAPESWAERILKAGRGLFLLDGLDELTPVRRREALDWIRELAAAYPPDNVIVVSSRPQALSPGILTDAQFVEYEVRELSPVGRIEFVEKWHAAVKRRYPNAPDVWEQLEGKRRRLLTELEFNWSLALLASNPLLCALLCALNRVYTQSLPENLRDLCDSACRMLLWDREQLAGATKHAAPPAYAALNYQMRLLVARNLAYVIAKESGSALSRSSAVEEVATALHGAADPDRAEAEGVLTGLIERSNLLRACGEDEVEFVHNALRDYLASLRFVVKGEYEFLVQKIDAGELERWEPVCLLAAATTQSETFGTQLLRVILNLREHDQNAMTGLKELSNETGRRRELVALKVARQVQYRLMPDLMARLRAIQEQMLPVDSVTKAETLTEAGEAAIEYLEYQQNREIAVAVACIRGLRRIGSDRAKVGLQDYLHRDQRPDLLEEQARFFSPDEMTAVVNVLQIPSIQKAVQTSDGAPQAYLPHLFDLSPLSALAGLIELSLRNTLVSDLSPISGLKGLQILYVNNTRVSDLSPLLKLNGLQTLSIDNTPVSDLSPLSKLTGLRQLSFDNTDVSDLSPLSALMGLRTLYLRNTPVSDLSPLSKLIGLQWLYLNNTQVSDLSPLLKLSELRVLSLNNTKIKPAEVKSFKQSRQAQGLLKVDIDL